LISSSAVLIATPPRAIKATITPNVRETQKDANYVFTEPSIAFAIPSILSVFLMPHSEIVNA
jgi:hypothetical protein